MVKSMVVELSALLEAANLIPVEAPEASQVTSNHHTSQQAPLQVISNQEQNHNQLHPLNTAPTLASWSTQTPTPKTKASEKST